MDNTSKRIVLVDDEPSISESMLRFFKIKFPNYETLAFTEPKKALEYLLVNKTDVLITDIKMPELDGLQLIRELRKNEVKPIVFIVSGFYSNEHQEEFKALGDFTFFTKPVSLRVIAEKIMQKLA